MRDRELASGGLPDLSARFFLTFSEAFFGPKGWRGSLRRYLIFAGPWTVATVALVVGFINPAEEFFVSFAISLFIAEVCMFSCYWGSHVVTMLERFYFARRGWVHKDRSGAAYTLRGTMFMLPALYVAFEIVGHFAPRFGLEWSAPRFADYRYGMLFGLVSTLVYVAWDLFRGKRDADRAIQSLESARLKAQVAALTAQMNPHLLFNSLNSIASMIHESPESAEAMTVELSNLYRRVLQASKHERHSLAAEMGLCRSYLEIEKARFGDRLNYEIEIGSGVDPEATEVPVLCVQPFVENGVKHGLLSQVSGGTLKVSAAACDGSLVVTVLDDGVGFGKAPKSKGSGTAIANCQERLRMLFGNGAGIDIGAAEPGTRVELRIPLGRGGKA